MKVHRSCTNSCGTDISNYALTNWLLAKLGQMGAVSVARYLLVIVLIHGLLLSQTSLTLTGVVAAARLEPSSEAGTPYNISARVSKDPPPPAPHHSPSYGHGGYSMRSPPPPLFK
ncbi:hypothetical protein Ancab_000975 [Ancistrocladus abbreviatus]